MTLGARIEERIKVLRLSQSELARRAKVPQTTINSLIRGSRRTTPHLLRLARELSTTPAYLTGETDDPEADAPTLPALDFETRELLDDVADMDPADRRAIAQIARSLTRRVPTGREGPATLHAPATSYRGPPVSENALGQMIEGLLRAVDLTAPVPELARELAELWPTAIAQVQGPLYALDDETSAAPAKSPATLASAGRAPR
ncbi:helix-turn-helix domain-containing protein [Sphingomonas echinoides]|uniref:Helix-turn-helix transcriptional regulator n=1 Tax=Sphingomonas echinoides TaxID=59803 RepID=A0ABU4PRT8_9SPHN|nr:helix-turn-helix transcriptional regulator [Sphingomonas echinoides]MDX5984675.1 helix-turn-helix transcriptional regulator [Sphingomonas echinoides]